MQFQCVLERGIVLFCMQMLPIAGSRNIQSVQCDFPAAKSPELLKTGFCTLQIWKKYQGSIFSLKVMGEEEEIR